MTKTLKLNFTDGNNKNTSITLTAAKENLTEQEVKNAMQKISSASVFNKKGVDLYANVKSASYVERDVTPIFDDSEKLKAARA